MPLIAGARLIALLVLASAQPDGARRFDAPWLRVIAQVAALALHQQDLAERSRRAARLFERERR